VKAAKQTLHGLERQFVVSEPNHEGKLQPTKHEGSQGKAKWCDSKVDVEASVLEPIAKGVQDVLVCHDGVRNDAERGVDVLVVIRGDRTRSSGHTRRGIGVDNGRGDDCESYDQLTSSE
jgi:hypothetical protein